MLISQKGTSSEIIDKEKKGKFAVEDFDNILTVNGQTAVEVDLDSLEEKPWRKPGADITDYFNYGFTEETWAAYCNRFKIIYNTKPNLDPVLNVQAETNAGQRVWSRIGSNGTDSNLDQSGKGDKPGSHFTGFNGNNSISWSFSGI